MYPYIEAPPAFGSALVSFLLGLATPPRPTGIRVKVRG